MPSLPEAHLDDLLNVAVSSRIAAEAAGHLPLAPTVLMWVDVDNGGRIAYVCQPNMVGNPIANFMRIMALAAVAHVEAMSLIVEVVSLDPDLMPHEPPGTSVEEVSVDELMELDSRGHPELAVVHVEPRHPRESLSFIPIVRDDDGMVSFDEPRSIDLPDEFPFVTELRATVAVARDEADDFSIDGVLAGLDVPVTPAAVVDVLRHQGDTVVVVT